VNQRADEPWRDGVQLCDQVCAAICAIDVLVDALEDLLDLLVEFRAVGDEQHAGVRHMLANPFGQPDHRQAFARTLRVPDDAALAALYMVLRGADAEILVVTAELFRPGVEDYEVVDEFEKARLATHLDQRTVQQVLDGALLLPRQVILLGRLDRAVAQALGVAARDQHLNRGEEMLDEDLLLVFQILADALGHRDGGTLQLQHAERDAVNVKHQVRAFRVGIIAGCRNSNFLGDGEMIILRILPINEPDIHGILAYARLHLHGVS
jgi:hypothetical protein